jgi:hypothetical protein
MQTVARDTLVEIPFVVSVTAVSAVWSLLDETGASLATAQIALFDVPTHTMTAVIPSNLNATDEQRAARTVVLEVTNADASKTIHETTYLIEAAAVLKIATNSFQTYEQAIVTRAGFGQMLPGWEVNQKSRRCAALETAYLRLCQMTYKFPYIDRDNQEYDLTNPLFEYDDGIYRTILRMVEINFEEFETFPKVFVAALRRAQLIEADIILGGDVVGSKRSLGIQSETIGEAKMFFRPGSPLDLPVSRAAFKELSGFVFRRHGVQRA